MLTEPQPAAAPAGTPADTAAAAGGNTAPPGHSVAAASGASAAPPAPAASAGSASPQPPAAAADACGDSARAAATEDVSLRGDRSTYAPGPRSSSAAAAPTCAEAAGGPARASAVHGAAAQAASPPSDPPSAAAGRLSAAAGTRVSPQAGERERTVAWGLDVESALLAACLNTLNYSACRDLERRVRSGSGTEDRARQAPCCPTPDAAGAAHPPQAAAAASAGHRQHAHGGSCCSEKKSRSNGYSAHGETPESTEDRTHAVLRPVPYKFKKDPEDHLGELLDTWVSPWRLRDLLGSIAERAAKVFNNVIERGKADGMDPPTGQEEKQLRLEILKEATIREVQLRIIGEVHEERKRDSREGGMLANPPAYSRAAPVLGLALQSLLPRRLEPAPVEGIRTGGHAVAFKQGHLSHLLPETIAALMKEGVAVQHNFVGEKARKMILDEIELLEYDGRFNEVFQQSLNPVRKDYMCWATLSDLDREKHQGLWQLFQSMQALPYELNKKAHLCLQISWVFQLAVYPGDGAYYLRHMDAGFSPALDNGRKITALYYPNPPDWNPSDGGYLRVYERWTRKEQLKMAPGDVAPYEVATSYLREIEPAGDTLVLLRSREMPHEVLATYRKRFAISLWMSGPPGPGDDV